MPIIGIFVLILGFVLTALGAYEWLVARGWHRVGTICVVALGLGIVALGLVLIAL